MPNFKVYGLGGNSVEIAAVRERVLTTICRVVLELRLQGDNIITLSSSQVYQAVPGLPPGKPYLELRTEDPIEMARVVMALEADGQLGIDIEMKDLAGFKSARQMSNHLVDKEEGPPDGPKKSPQLSLLDPSARQMSNHLDDDGGDELNAPEESNGFPGAEKFDF